jgi:CDP-glucose 4,6-dehydratase
VGKPESGLENMAMIPPRPASLDPAFWQGKRVLLTGHTGFKGSWLLVMLHQLGAEVTGISLAPPAGSSMFDQIGGSALCDHHVADIRDSTAVRRITAQARPEVVLHLAAQPLVRLSYDDPLGTFATNVLGTAHVLDAAREIGGLRAIVSVTTDKCYANDGRVEGYREDARLGGHDPYSNSKACAELVSQCFRDSFLARSGVGLATARAGNVIGGGDYAADRLVPDAVRAFGKGRLIAIRNPDAVRPWQHVLEPLTGYCLLAEQLAADPSRFAGGWNFGPAAADMAPVSRVVRLLAQAWEQDGSFLRQPGDHPHEAAMLTLDSTKAGAQLGWTPRLSLEQSVGWSAEWYRGVAAGADALGLTSSQFARYTEVTRSLVTAAAA